MAQKSWPSGAPILAAAASMALMPGMTVTSISRQWGSPVSIASNTAAAMAKTPGSPPETTATSLSDNLKPWEIVEKRLIAAAEGDFVIALYNPASKARPERIQDAFACLRASKAWATPVIFARAVGRADERIIVTSLAEADPGIADMATLVIIGSSETRLVPRPGGARPFVYTPRSYGALR